GSKPPKNKQKKNKIRNQKPPITTITEKPHPQHKEHKPDGGIKKTKKPHLFFLQNTQKPKTNRRGLKIKTCLI
ncbi:hypothetical protein ACNIV2_25250, partial [Escherichia coli]